MSTSPVHLIENCETYNDTEVWCDEDFPREYSDWLTAVTCVECLRQFLQQAKVVRLRLDFLEKQVPQP